jgi:hypothetical protein
MMIVVAPAVAAAGPVTILTLIAVLLSGVAALVATVDTLHARAIIAFTFDDQPQLLLALAICIGALLGPIAPASMHICFRLSRNRSAESAAVGLCAAALPLASFLLSAAAQLPHFPHSDDVVCWLPVLLSAGAAVRYLRALMSSRRIHPQDIAHDSKAFEMMQMNSGARPLIKAKGLSAALQSEKVLKKWAFGYLYLALQRWQVLPLICAPEGPILHARAGIRCAAAQEEGQRVDAAGVSAGEPAHRQRRHARATCDVRRAHPSQCFCFVALG